MGHIKGTSFPKNKFCQTGEEIKLKTYNEASCFKLLSSLHTEFWRKTSLSAPNKMTCATHTNAVGDQNI